MGTTNLIEVVLNVNPNGPLGWLNKAKAVGSSTTENASMFTAIASVLAQLASDTAELDKDQSATATKGTDRTSARNATLTNVKKSLRSTRGAVQGLCDNAPDIAHATAIAIAAAFGVRTKGVRTKPPFAGRVPGKKGARVYYEWRMSTDGGVTWTSLPGTNVSTTMVQGLTAGQKVVFESRTTMKDTVSAWSQAINVIVL
jgi:hypothetical protein